MTRNMPQIVQGVGFRFVPYDYGPFDADVYNEAAALHHAGEAVIAPSGMGRWNAATESGVARGRALLRALPAPAQQYLSDVSTWVTGGEYRGVLHDRHFSGAMRTCSHLPFATHAIHQGKPVSGPGEQLRGICAGA